MRTIRFLNAAHVSIPVQDDQQRVHPRALEDEASAELLDIRDAGEHRLVVILPAHAPADWGERGPHGQVVTVRDSNVT